MEEGRWALRVLNEIGSARAAIAASYLRLWRTAAEVVEDEPAEPVRGRPTAGGAAESEEVEAEGGAAGGPPPPRSVGSEPE